MTLLTCTRLLSAAAVTAALTIGGVLGWPIWLWFLLPALCAAALLMDMRVPRPESRRPDDSDSDGAAPEPAAEAAYEETSVVVVPVDSAVADCPFLFSATIWWRPVDEDTTFAHRNPAALAVTSVLRRVQRTTSAQHPSRCAHLEREIEGSLGVPVPDDVGLVTAFATDIRLVLRQRDQEYLEELDALRKDMGTWESRRQHERNLREYLGEDVLRSPGSAVVWWMARHDDEIERAVEMIAPLTILSAAANDEEIPEEYHDLFWAAGGSTEEPRSGFDHPEPPGEEDPPDGEPQCASAEQQSTVGDYIDGLLDRMDFAEGAPERRAFLQRLAQMSEAAGRPEAAEYIRVNLRGEGQENAPASAGPWIAEEGPRRATGNGRLSPSYVDHGPDAVRKPSAADWQVTPEGLVSEADQTTWHASEEVRQNRSDEDHEGSEW
ncbi:hypothetical protein ACH4PU_08955 [Streptomyces sp. NPDC021100]|uniref:hypothetical protein n=1 Tax=Streptomyces sp. NPDC021100 TaxID=3365114 RepID=UPI00378AE7C4